MTAKQKMALVFATASVLPTPAALAAARVCSPEPVDADAAIRSRWPDLAAAIGAAIDGRDDVDTCARVALRLDPSGILLRVNLLDGRSAARAVSRQEDVVPTLVALLMLPEGGAAVLAPALSSGAAPATATPAAVPPVPRGGSATVTLGATPPAGPAVARPRPSATTVAEPSASSLPSPPDSDPFRLEVSLATAGRVGDGYRGISLGALTAFEVGGWLGGLQAAAARYDRADESPGTSSLLLAVLGGRRFRFKAPSTVSIDLTAGPALAVRGFGSRTAVRAPAGSGEAPPAPDDGPWARLVAGAHVSFRARSVVRPFAGIDGEAALGTWAAAPVGAEPRLPAWTLGLVVGATVGTP